MKRYYFFVASLAILLSSHNVSAQGTWKRIADFPGIGRNHPFAFSIGTKGYVGGGEDTLGAYLRDFWEYDPATDTWTQKPDFPDTRANAGAFSINDKGYVCLGQGSTGYVKELWEYDAVANSWTRKADFGGLAKIYPAAFSIGTKGYVGTGAIYNGGFTEYKDFWEWDQATDTWTQKLDVPVARGWSVGFAINGKGYISTGYPGLLKDLWEYDPLSGVWTQRADFPGTARMDVSAFTLCNMGYLGTGGETPYYNDFYQYNPATNSWARMTDFPGHIRDDCAFFSIGNKGYIGIGQYNNSYLYPDFYEYTPDSAGLAGCTSLPVTTNFTPSDTTLCAFDCITFNSQSVNAGSYYWLFPGGTPSSSTLENPFVCYNTAGDYDVTLIASNSGSVDTLTISNAVHVHPSPIPPTIIQDDTLLYFTSDPSYIAYQWFDSVTIIPGATDTFLVVHKSGQFNVRLTNTFECNIAVGITIVLGNKDEETGRDIMVYPNPAGSSLEIRNLRSGCESINIYNALGELIYAASEGLLSKQELTLDVSQYPTGVYILKVEGQNNSRVFKFLKE